MTAFAVDNLRLGDQRRHRLAVLYRHLLLHTPPPKNLLRQAAETLGLEERQVSRLAYQVRDRINEHRPFMPIDSLEELGLYLVVTSGYIGLDDL